MANKRAHVVDFDDYPLKTTSPIDSEEYNDIINSLKTSTIRAINRSRDLSTKMTNWNKALVAENGYLAGKINELQSTYYGLPTTNDSMIITGYDKPVSEQKYNIGTTRDQLTGNITLNAETGRRWSKVVRYTDSNGKQRPSRDTYISLDGTTMSRDNSIYNILDGRSDTFWLLDTAAAATHSIVINFPSSIRPYVNNIALTPFPAFSFRLDSMIVNKADSTQVNVTPLGVEAASMAAVNVHFAPTSWGNQIVINITANGSVVGISNLDIFLTDYINSGEFTYELTSFENKAFSYISYVNLMDFGLFGITEEDGTYNASKQTTVTARVGSTVSSATSYPINEKTLRNEGISEVPKLSGSKFYMSFAFNKYEGQTPTFRSAIITYRS